VPKDFSPLLDKEALKEHYQVGGPWAVESGQRVRKLRKDRGLTIEQLASLTDSTAATISRVELGAILPSDRLRVAIAFALVVEVADLWVPLSRPLVKSLAAA